MAGAVGCSGPGGGGIGFEVTRDVVQDRPEISVIIPHMNQPEALARCLDSLARQTFPRERFEVIVVDNGSREPPREIVGRFPGVRLEHEATPGPGPARNHGVALSTGDILAFIDADCRADEAWLQAISSEYRSENGDAILGGCVRLTVINPARPTAAEAYEKNYAFRQELYIHKHKYSVTCNLAMRRHIFQSVGSFRGIELAEDKEWGQRAAKLGYELRLLPLMVVYHPARASVAALKRKWRRQITHDFAEWQKKGRGSFQWVLRGVALAASPLFELPRVMISNKLHGMRERVLALGVLTYIRWYRAFSMVRVLKGDSSLIGMSDWGRSH